MIRYKLKEINEKREYVFFNNLTDEIEKAWNINIKQIHINSKNWLEKPLLEELLLENKLYNLTYEEYIEEVMEECKKYDTYYFWKCIYGKKQ